MHIVVLCATHRGLVFARRLSELQPGDRLTVISFREVPWEPAYLDDIRSLAGRVGAGFLEAREPNTPVLSDFMESAEIDLMFLVNWRYILPEKIYSKARLGTFVFHDSLLPRYRGFSPTVWAMINGDQQTGVTLFHISSEYDAGDIVEQKVVEIGEKDTIRTVMDRVTQSYLDLLEKNLPALRKGNAARHPQNHALATYTCKRMPEDNEIQWASSTRSIYNLIRAVTFPYPGAFTFISQERVRVWEAHPLQDYRNYSGRIPGRVVEIRNGEGVVVLTGDGALLVTRVQKDGCHETAASEVLGNLSVTLGRGISF